MQNIAEWLTNDEDLIDIKTRAVRDVRLNKILDPEVKRRTYLFSIILNVVIIPLIIILYGIRRFSRRRKQQRRVEE